MSNLNGFKEFHLVSSDRHPGLWFEHGFASLSDPEKVAWLELFTLAYASYPSGHINYVSEGQISALFSIEKEALRSVIRKTLDLGLIDVVEKAIIPASARSKDGMPEGLTMLGGSDPRMDLSNAKPWARYKSMFFPGYYEYRDKSPGEEGQPNNEQFNWVSDKHPLDIKVSDPFGLLSYRIRKAWGGELLSAHTGESPISRLPIIDLPEATRIYDDASVDLNLELLKSLDCGLALWNENHDDLMRMIMSNWEALQDWFLYYVVRDGTTIARVETAKDFLSKA